jgi:hypothetical protein
MQIYAYANPAHTRAGFMKPNRACLGTGLSAYSSCSVIKKFKEEIDLSI